MQTIEASWILLYIDTYTKALRGSELNISDVIVNVNFRESERLRAPGSPTIQYSYLSIP